MYKKHFGLQSLPFENVPDPAFFFDHGDYHRILQRMTESLAAGKGLMAVAGPIGAGKTTLSQKLMADLSDTTRLVWLAEPPKTAAGLMLYIGQELGLESVPEERVFAMRDLRARLLRLRESGQRCLMIIDECHLVSDDTLEGIRLLNNLEEGPDKLLQIILIGQQELVENFARPELESFRQRIAAQEVIGKMDPPRLREYVLHRLKVAGARGPLFSDDALEAVIVSTGGIPRVTNSLCDRSLRVTREAGKPLVEAPEVHQAAVDLGMGRNTLHYILKLRAEKEEKERNVPREEERGGEETPEEASCPREESEESPEQGERASLAGPLLFLVLSVAAFAGSLWFYCSRVGVLASGSCLERLVQGFF